MLFVGLKMLLVRKLLRLLEMLMILIDEDTASGVAEVDYEVSKG